MDALLKQTNASTPRPEATEASSRAALTQSASQLAAELATQAQNSGRSAPTGAARQTPAPAGLQRINSEQLLNGAREMEIEHGGSLYRLRLTALGKLILTK